MRTLGVLKLFTVVALAVASTTAVAAQAPPPVSAEATSSGAAQPAVAGPGQVANAGEPDKSGTAEPQQAPPAKVAPPQTSQASSRQAAIEQEQAAKVPTLHPYVPSKAERYFDRLDAILEGGGLAWHPFFDSAYSGGGFTLGVGRAQYVSAYNLHRCARQLLDRRLQAS